MFNRIGLFRFVTDQAHPVPALEAALKAQSDPGGSLIVLPEAFNIGKDYLDKATVGRRDPKILDDLQSIAKAHSVTFVAGLVIDQPDGPNAPAKPFSSAYLIDEAGPTLLCRKMSNDGTGNYTPCQSGHDPNNPIHYGDVVIASLICLDSAGDELAVRERERRLKQTFSAERGLQKVVCVPANMSHHYLQRDIAKGWLGACFILANSRSGGCRGLIAMGDVVLVEDDQADSNALLLYGLFASKCLSCFAPLYAPNRCIHRQRYLDVLSYVNSRGIVIETPDYEFFAWKGADSYLSGNVGDTFATNRRIRISSVAYKIYGWDVMTSVLIHEFGHCDLFKEGIGSASSWDESARIESLANQRGLDIMPGHLVPEDYQRHRDFFLKAYLEEGWREEKCLKEWQMYSALVLCKD